MLKFYFLFKTQFVRCLFFSEPTSQLKCWQNTQQGSSVASAQLTGPQNHQGGRLWGQAWVILPPINCANCRVPFTSTDSADAGSFWSRSEHSQRGDGREAWGKPWAWHLFSIDWQAVVPWVTTGSVKIEYQFKKPVLLMSSSWAPFVRLRENGGALIGTTSASNQVRSLELLFFWEACERGSYDKAS